MKRNKGYFVSATNGEIAKQRELAGLKNLRAIVTAEVIALVFAVERTVFQVVDVLLDRCGLF